MLNEWELSVHHVDESKSVIRGGVLTFLDDVGVNERNGIRKRSLGDRTDYIAAVGNANICVTIDTDRGVQCQRPASQHRVIEITHLCLRRGRFRGTFSTRGAGSPLVELRGAASGVWVSPIEIERVLSEHAAV